MKDPVLSFHEVSKEYANGDVTIAALREVSVEIERGEFTALVGPSGSGKSTLLHLGAGIDRPTRGSVELLGRDLSAVSEREISVIRNRKVGFIFQTFNLIPVLTVAENVEYPCLLYAESRENRRRVRELLELTGLGTLDRRRPKQLSGGQQQRVAIARALVNDPAVVFADEPTANLDHRTGDTIMTLLKDLNERLGTTILFSTHDQRIMGYASRVISLEDGRVRSER